MEVTCKLHVIYNLARTPTHTLTYKMVGGRSQVGPPLTPAVPPHRSGRRSVDEADCSSSWNHMAPGGAIDPHSCVCVCVRASHCVCPTAFNNHHNHWSDSGSFPSHIEPTPRHPAPAPYWRPGNHNCDKPNTISCRFLCGVFFCALCVMRPPVIFV